MDQKMVRVFGVLVKKLIKPDPFFFIRLKKTSEANKKYRLSSSNA